MDVLARKISYCQKVPEVNCYDNDVHLRSIKCSLK